jgi:hypothetical protein
MAWTNYRNIVRRFRHIDAEFVKAAGLLSSERRSAELVVRFYPWWEHPRYLSARERGEDWGFSSYEAGKREVTVRAIQPWALRLSPRQEVVDWRFEEDHPLLWDFAEESIVFANASFDRGAFFNGLIGLGLPNVSEADLLTSIHLPDSSKAPMGLTMPAQLHEPVLTVFRRLGVPVSSPGSPRTPDPAVVFLIDDDDYIIAEDFEVDVPEFVHEPEWFQPVGVASRGERERSGERS